MNPTDSTHLRRLGAAVEVFLRHRASPDGASDADLLERHVDLRDLLEPMLEHDEEWEPSRREGESQGAVRRLGDFELVAEIGRGGMGTVYEAREHPLGRRVALKLLRADLTLQPRQIERFRREAAAAARLRHDGIAQVYRVGEVDGVHFIAMELIDGPSLATVIEQLAARCGGSAQRAFDETLGVGFTGGFVVEACELCAQVADALQFSHDQGVLHRDVKPQNVVLPGAGRACLVDFGLAKDAAGSTLSQTGDLSGTPHYMSPEQATGGNKVVDARADVYALGVVLYELLTLRCPFDGESTHDVLQAIVHREPDPLRRVNPRVPRDLETVCLVALEKDRDRRYATAGDFAADLRRFLAHDPIEAQPIGGWTRGLRLARRHKAATLSAVLAFLLIVVAPLTFSVYVWQAREALAREQAATAQQRDLARTALEKARLAMNELFTSFAEEDVAPVPQLEALRQRLLERAVPFHEEFLALAPQDPELQLAAVESQVRLGNVLQLLGRNDEALLRLSQGIDALTEQRAAGDRRRLQVLEAEARELHARVLTRMGRVDEAARERDDALALYRAVLAEADDPVVRTAAVVALAVALTSAAKDSMSRAGRSDDVEAALLEAARLWGTLAESEREHPERLSKQASLQRMLGRWCAGHGDLERADVCLTEGRRLAERGLESSPGHVVLRRLVADIAMDAGRVADQLDRPAAARRAFARGLELSRGLAADFPRYPAFRQQMAMGLHTQGVFFALHQEFAAAEACLVEALSSVEQLVAEAPSSVPAVSLLCGVCDLLAAVQQKLPGRDPERIAAGYARAVAAVRPLVEAQPDYAPLLVNLSNALSNWGAFELDHGDLKRARVCLEEALEHQQRVCEIEPDHPRAQKNLGMVRQRLAALALREEREAAESEGGR